MYSIKAIPNPAAQGTSKKPQDDAKQDIGQPIAVHIAEEDKNVRRRNLRSHPIASITLSGSENAVVPLQKQGPPQPSGNPPPSSAEADTVFNPAFPPRNISARDLTLVDQTAFPTTAPEAANKHHRSRYSYTWYEGMDIDNPQSHNSSNQLPSQPQLYGMPSNSHWPAHQCSSQGDRYQGDMLQYSTAMEDNMGQAQGGQVYGRDTLPIRTALATTMPVEAAQTHCSSVSGACICQQLTDPSYFLQRHGEHLMQEQQVLGSSGPQPSLPHQLNCQQKLPMPLQLLPGGQSLAPSYGGVQQLPSTAGYQGELLGQQLGGQSFQYGDFDLALGRTAITGYQQGQMKGEMVKNREEYLGAGSSGCPTYSVGQDNPRQGSGGQCYEIGQYHSDQGEMYGQPRLEAAGQGSGYQQFQCGQPPYMQAQQDGVYGYMDSTGYQTGLAYGQQGPEFDYNHLGQEGRLQGGQQQSGGGQGQQGGKYMIPMCTAMVAGSGCWGEQTVMGTFYAGGSRSMEVEDYQVQQLSKRASFLGQS